MLTPLLSLLLAATSPIAGSSVNVAYAGSLVTPMERTIGPQFMQFCSCTYNGEGRGSAALVHLIASGLRHPDVFISADPALMEQLLHPRSGRPLISWYAIFARSPIVLGYSQKSAFGSTIARTAAGRMSIASLLETPHLRIGRTDPSIDPKGARTLEDIAQLSRSSGDPALLKAVQDSGPFPEEDLLVRLESGDLDVAFLYAVEARSRTVPSLELPSYANGGAVYAVTVLNEATNKPGADAFARFITSGAGKGKLAEAGLDSYRPSIRGNAREALRALGP
ncbi:MAG: substrate-binding domain-containing protein [Candidatus Eremiobacteraeota bacterium]|nr:substrate-binding domain-containing protein [Candidatus Eremiobacteraeota bacterium]